MRYTSRYEVPIIENNEALVSLEGKGFVLDYNYFNQGLALRKHALLREGALARLQKAKEALPDGYNFKIYDPYRSIDTQQRMWDQFEERIRKENPQWDAERIHTEVLEYAAPITNDPLTPPNHNTGGAVDLTILDEKGNELDMGGDFDETTERSFSGYYKGAVTEEEKLFHSNRMLLHDAMVGAGFVYNHNEWWHFDYGNQKWAYLLEKDNALYGGVDLLEEAV